FELIHVDGPNVVTYLEDDPDEPFNVENSFDMVSVELMKIWRLKPFHYGSVLEIFAGARYAR
ncbi:MAG: hypothetical protein GTO53_14735, partial [Planctomycetales bacterium]|nr:hypothetical protein [Planctomycetales bacterium]NIM10339.1 hypothetical protein [Planctomycetales bacterium]NIN08886.1 hypothetical protein [Planctomycetales bacterium]NIN78001.1 hypothetical protein [Planctomycetales bacterium]NIO35189.1 hypothetical protein [Planctomycetales bacterium]